jgi:signal transduction histidine kinase/ligand-binding sensor domain-containing protein
MPFPVLLLAALASLTPSRSVTCADAPQVASAQRAASPPASPPRGRLAFRSYGGGEGLDDLATNLITQDTDGYLWVATQSGGVFRYDGARFQGYGRGEGLPSDLVRALAVAPDGALWVGTSGGLAVRGGGSDRFETAGAEEGLGTAQIAALAFDDREGLWVGTTRGLYLRARAGEPFTVVPGWAAREVTALRADRGPDGGVFVGQAGVVAHIARDGRTASWGRDAGLEAAPVTSIAKDGLGRLWVRTLDGLRVRNGDGRTFDDRSCLLPARGHDAPLEVDRAGDLLVPTGGGLLVVRGDAVERIDRTRGLPSDFANHAFEDREGSLWVASVGLHKALGRGLWSTYAAPEGLPNNIVWAIARGPGGRLYVGTESGLGRATADGFETVPHSDGLTFGGLQLGPDGAGARGDLWSTGSTAGLLRIDPSRDAITRYGGESGLVSGDITLQLLITSGPAVWVSTRRNGLYRGDESSGALRFSPQALPGGETTERVNAIHDGGGDRIWFAGTRGLAVKDHGELRRFTRADGLVEDAIGTVVTRRNGEVCVGYRGQEGVTCFRYERGALSGVHAVDVRQGHRAVQFLGEDAAGRLWAGTTLGVSVIGDHGVDVFGTGDGTPGDDCAELAFLAEPGGEVWIGTSTGLGRFDGAAYTGPVDPPRAVLTGARVGDRVLTPPFVESTRIPYGRGSLAVRFSALSFANEARVAYETRLVGVDDAWQPSEIHQAQYGALAPGAYRFEVRARVGEGAPGAVARVAFQVLPAWWQSWWFRALVVAAGLSLVGAVLRLRLRALQAQNVELEKLVAARTADLAHAQQAVAEGEKLAALGRLIAQLSHELNNPVSVISNNIGPIQDYVKDLLTGLAECRALAEASPEGRVKVAALWESLELAFKAGDIDDAVRVVALAADRIAAVHDDLRTFMRGGQAIRTKGDVREQLHETVEMMQRTLPGVTFIEDYEDVPPITFDRGRMNQVFLNLLQNAGDATGGHGEVRVATRTLEDAVEISVSDTGPGVPGSVRSRIFEPFFTTKDVGVGTGLGLAVCRRIVVEDHGGALELDDAYTAGARFVMRLPRVASARSAAPAGVDGVR